MGSLKGIRTLRASISLSSHRVWPVAVYRMFRSVEFILAVRQTLSITDPVLRYLETANNICKASRFVTDHLQWLSAVSGQRCVCLVYLSWMPQALLKWDPHLFRF